MKALSFYLVTNLTFVSLMKYLRLALVSTFIDLKSMYLKINYWNASFIFISLPLFSS